MLLSFVAALVVRWRKKKSALLSEPAETRQRVVASMDELKAKSRILIIDDKPKTSAYYEQLKIRGFSTTIWKRVKSDELSRIDRDYELILLDDQGVSDDMGSKSGQECATMIRRDNPCVQILLFTAYPSEEKTEMKNLDDILTKSVSFAEFEEKVLTMLLQYRSDVRHKQTLLKFGATEEEAKKILDATSETSYSAAVDSAARNHEELQGIRIKQAADTIRGVRFGKRWSER